jgi:hypothetical protein
MLPESIYCTEHIVGTKALVLGNLTRIVVGLYRVFIGQVLALQRNGQTTQPIITSGETKIVTDLGIPKRCTLVGGWHQRQTFAAGFCQELGSLGRRYTEVPSTSFIEEDHGVVLVGQTRNTRVIIQFAINKGSGSDQAKTFQLVPNDAEREGSL